MDITIIFLSIIIVILAVFAAIISFYFFQTHQKIDALLEKGKIKEFKDIFLSQKEKNAELQQSLQEAFLRIEQLEAISKKTIQKTAVLRFDPFKELGGKQSFVVAFLDAENNGVVISSIFVKDGNRVYSKVIKKGKSDYVLSEEEVKAINNAVNSN